MNKDIVFTIKDISKIKIKNNLSNYSFSVESKTNDSPNKSYNSILNTVAKIKTKLINNKKVSNIKINYRINSDYQYKPTKKLLGYKAIAYITFEFSINNGDDMKDAHDLQNDIIKQNNNVLLNSTHYTISNKLKKESESLVIKKSLSNAKIKANMLLENTYPNKKYSIIGLETDTGNNISIYRGLQAESKSHIIPQSQGESEISGTVIMKIKIN